MVNENAQRVELNWSDPATREKLRLLHAMGAITTTEYDAVSDHVQRVVLSQQVTRLVQQVAQAQAREATVLARLTDLETRVAKLEEQLGIAG